MAVPFSNTKLRVPHGFESILEGLAREILLMQPNDIYGFAAVYFENMLRIREDGGEDSASRVIRLKDRMYNNKAFEKSNADDCGEESEQAALTIQTKYRQYQAKAITDELHQNNAAIKIQAGVRGFVARKQVNRIRTASKLKKMEVDEDDESDKELQVLMVAEMVLEQVMDPVREKPVLYVSPTNVIADEESDVNKTTTAEPQAEEEVDIDLTDPDVQKAAVFIQSSFKGFKAKKLLGKGIGKIPLAIPEKAETPAYIEAPPVMRVKCAEPVRDKSVPYDDDGDDLFGGADVKSSPLPDVERSTEQQQEIVDEEPAEEEERLEPISLEIDVAVVKIQAGFRGMKVRQEFRMNAKNPDKEQQDEISAKGETEEEGVMADSGENAEEIEQNDE